jgi:hypothetical protein
MDRATYNSRAAWRELSAAEQEHHIFSALGGDRMRPRDVGLKLDVAGWWDVRMADARRILDRMVELGDVECIKQPRGSRYLLLYERCSQPLSPELVALEQALNDEAA